MVLRAVITLFISLYGMVVISDNVPPAYEKIAQHYHVPAEVFYAIALTESGRDVSGIYRPWPWTLNVAGQAQFFSTRADAQAALEHAIANNVRQIDIGLMQVNWAYHHSRVSHAAELLDPYTNLHTAGQILTEYRENKDLWSAVGRYHSGTADIAKTYRSRVAKRLVNFLERRHAAPVVTSGAESLSLSVIP